jgi:hypothetical protein
MFCIVGKYVIGNYVYSGRKGDRNCCVLWEER